jgi:hypothetical protein
MDDIFAIRKRPTKFGWRKGSWLSLIDVDWKRISPTNFVPSIQESIPSGQLRTIIYGPTIARLNFVCGTPVYTVSDVSHRVY